MHGENLCAENARLRSHIRDCQNEQERTRQQADAMARDAAEKELQLAAVEQQVRQVELEVNEKETHTQRINADIDSRRQVLDKAKESSKEVDKIIEDLRSIIDVLKKDESTLT